MIFNQILKMNKYAGLKLSRAKCVLSSIRRHAI